MENESQIKHAGWIRRHPMLTVILGIGFLTVLHYVSVNNNSGSSSSGVDAPEESKPVIQNEGAQLPQRDTVGPSPDSVSVPVKRKKQGVDQQENPVPQPLSPPPAPTPTQLPPPEPPSSPTPDFSSFQRLHIDVYAKNPPQYFDQNVEVVAGAVNDFLAAGDRGGDVNDIEVENTLDPSLDTMMVRIDSNADYQKILSILNKGDLINVFGIGVPSQKFTTAFGESRLIPTIKMLRIDLCAPYNCKEGMTKRVWP